MDKDDIEKLKRVLVPVTMGNTQSEGAMNSSGTGGVSRSLSQQSTIPSRRWILQETLETDRMKASGSTD